MQVERKGRALDDFEDVGVVVENALVVAFHESGGLGEIVDAARLFTFVKVIGDGDGSIGLKPGPPELVGEGDVCKWDRGKLIAYLFVHGRTCWVLSLGMNSRLRAEVG